MDTVCIGHQFVFMALVFDVEGLLEQTWVTSERAIVPLQYRK